MRKYLSLMIFAVLLNACAHSGKERILKSDMPIQELKATKIPVKEILNPVDVVILDDYIVFQNERKSGENCFFVYSAEGMNFCYAFGLLGKGPASLLHREWYSEMRGIYYPYTIPPMIKS
jgi:hypothetical protein